MSPPQQEPTLWLDTINLGRLESSDANERKRMIEAMKNQGFLYLDLSSNPQLVQDWENVLLFMSNYFANDMEVKNEDARQSDNYGYEPVATSTGAVNGKPDYYESLKASKDSLHWDSSKVVPCVAAQNEMFRRFVDTADEALQTILRESDIEFSRALPQKLQSLHRPEEPSLSTLAMFRYPKQDNADVGVGHNKHTDLGTLTFLLTQTPGLQVLAKNGWQNVAPKKSCAIINVGDTLRFLSGNSLKSAVHRVTPVDGKLQREDRYSIAYFLRAENEALLTDNSGRAVSAKAWHDEKFDVFRESHADQAKRAILTGGMEQNEALIV